jgi:hypothetical protein
MIALLPVRAWVGDAMAVDRGAWQLNATNNIATNDQLARTTGLNGTEFQQPAPVECPMAALFSAPSPSGDQMPSAVPDAPCGSCDTCELCLAIVTVAAPLAWVQPAGLHAPPGVDGYAFSSAEPLAGFKPPIS